MRLDAVERMDILAAPSEDVALLRSFVDRDDRQALGALFGRHADAAYRLALRLCRNSADAEDSVQAAFIEVLRQAAKYRGASTVKAWVMGFVVNACRHKAREEGRRAVREERAARPEGREPAGRELEEGVRAAVQDLPDPYRAPLWLHYCEGLSSGEVAETLSLPENTVRSQLSRGVDQLRGALAGAGLSVAGPAVLAALAGAAVETAPASLTASLAGLASSAAPAAAVPAGLVAKIAAGSVAAASVLSTAVFLWWGGLPDEIRPPDLARVEQKVREWQPTPEERRFDEIGWARDVREALRLARESGRPVVVVTLAGAVQLGRSDGGSLSLRAGPLADERVIALMNARFVPVYHLSSEKGVEPAERDERRRIFREAIAAKLSTGVEHLYILEPGGRPVDSISLCKTTPPLLLEMLRQTAAKLQAPEGKPLVAPSPQSFPPEGEEYLLHVTCRYLDREGKVETRRDSYHEYPAEAWLPLDAARLLPPDLDRVGSEREIDPATAGLLLSHFYPLTGNFKDPSTNRLSEHTLTAKVETSGRRIGWVRLEGRVRMLHSFYPEKDERLLEATVLGFLSYDRVERKVKSLRMATERATYGKEGFGVAVRSHP